MLEVLPGLCIYIYMHIYTEGLWFTLMQNLNPGCANDVEPSEC